MENNQNEVNEFSTEELKTGNVSNNSINNSEFDNNGLNYNGVNYTNLSSITTNYAIPGSSTATNPSYKSEPTKKINKKQIKMIATVIVVVLLCVGGFFAYKELTKPVYDLNEYLTVDFYGYDGYGSYQDQFAYETLSNDIVDQMDLSGRQADRVRDILEDCVSYEITNVGDLKNGDVINVVWKVNKSKLEKKYKCKIKYNSTTISVNNLDPIEKYNPFDDMVVSYSGIAPYGKVEINYSKSATHTLKYTVSKEDGLKNGDVITVSIAADKDYYGRIGGIDITETEKDYTVSGLASYVAKVDDLSDVDMQILIQDAEDALNAYIARKWDNPGDASLSFEGVYLLTPKEGVKTWDKNYMFIIHKITDASNGVDSYYYTRYRDMIILDDGTFSVDLTDKEVPEGGEGFIGLYGDAFRVGDRCYVGYENKENLFNDCVTADIDEFNYESTVQ